MIKYGGIGIWKRIHGIISRVWEDEQMPHEWNVGVICPIHKKGNKRDCNNYRCIILPSEHGI